MCIPGLDPATMAIMAASAAMSAGGSAMASADADDRAAAVATARNQALRDSLARQRKFADEAGGLLSQRIAGFQPGEQTQNLEKAQTERAADTTRNIAPAASTPGEIPLSGDAPQVVKGEIAKRMLGAFTDATDRAKALGKLGGYGGAWFENGLGVTDTARRVGTINNFSRGDATLLPAEQDLAEVGASRPASPWGPILMAGGNMLAGAAGRGFNPFGGARPALSPVSTMPGPGGLLGHI